MSLSSFEFVHAHPDTIKWHSAWLTDIWGHEHSSTHKLLSVALKLRAPSIVVYSTRLPFPDPRVAGAFVRSSVPIVLMHLGDEYGMGWRGLYSSADAVVRNFWDLSVDNKRVWYMPIGYRTGTQASGERPAFSRRPYTWSFAGELKSSRQYMIDNCRRVDGGRAFITSRWDDPQGLGAREYGKLMRETVFVPCGRGNQHLDCLRVYEALEAGAIPVLEDGPTLMHRGIAIARKNVPLTGYWDNALGTDCPCPRLTDWFDFPAIVSSCDAESLGQEVSDWWISYKAHKRSELTELLAKLT